MIEALFLLGACAVTVLLVYWAARVDDIPQDKPMIGPFAYKPGKEPPRPAARKPAALRPDRPRRPAR